MRAVRDAGHLAIAIATIFVSTIRADQVSIGPNGIDSKILSDVLFLNGTSIHIGQVETGRPGVSGMDSANNVHTSVTPVEVFRQDVPAGMDAVIENHAIQVAGVMISSDAVATGVATGASLHSSAVDLFPPGIFYEETAISLQHIAARNADDVRAINMSFGQPKETNAFLDGNSLLTLFLDWSATAHDVLYVASGEQGNNTPVPKDNYNGMTVASAIMNNGVFRQVAPANLFGVDEDAFGPRTSTDLIAPGIDIQMPIGNQQIDTNSGTSFAAPHVTGTVALLQEFAERQINTSVPNWSPNARRHEVMKAVLMNSADKLQDSGDGNRLGMSRTVLDQGGDDWLMSNAYTDDEIPLDIQMGAGHLNARRASTQFEPGEFDPDGAAVPVVGWDYGSTDGEDDINKYALASPLAANQFVSITLAWDREVLFNIDAGTTGEYDVGDTFVEDLPFNDLDLYLMPAGATGLNDYVTNGSINGRSISGQSTLEHIFFEIPANGSYEIWVHHFSTPIGFGQDYALAWWMDDVPPAVVLQGDYNGDDIVDVDDYNIWKNAFGTPNAAADGNGNGIVDAADYTVWRDHLGQMAGAGSIASLAVPEPNGATIFMLAAILAFLPRRRAASAIRGPFQLGI